MKILLWILIIAISAAYSAAQTTRPTGSADNAKEITSADAGPELDPVKFANSPYNAIPLFRSLRSFVSGSYATANVWIYAAGDEQALYDSPITYTYPKFYHPTWGEVFDLVARQTRCTWSWNPKNRQFKFERSTAEPFFGVTLADGWRREDRGNYVWHAPKDQQFGMDIYYYGHFTAPAGDTELAKKVCGYYGVHEIAGWPNAPTEDQMSTVKVGDADALYIKLDTPRPGGVWRQWSILIDGNEFVIVSAMPKDREKDLVPAIEKMVDSFKLKSPATRPTR